MLSGSAKGKLVPSSSSPSGTCASPAREATRPRTEKKLGMLLEGKERDGCEVQTPVTAA